MSMLRTANTWDISESGESDIETQSNVTINGRNAIEKTSSISAQNRSTEHKRLPSSLVSEGQTSARSGGPDTSSPARKRRSKQEIEADRQTARERREARERERAARAQEKEERRQEQRRRREAAENLKTLRPENYLKSLTVCIDPGARSPSAALTGTIHRNASINNKEAMRDSSKNIDFASVFLSYL